MPTFSERHHNTREQVTDYLRAALEVVDELDIPDDLRPAAFVQAVGLFSAKQVTMEQLQPGLDLGALRGAH
jgi:hypothetical protein